MQIAIIDLGTNTFNLMVAEINENNDYSILLQTKYAAKIGKGGINNNTITPEAFERGFTALETHLKTLERFNVESINCFATAAIRSATNGQEFVKQVKERYNLDINVIPGQKEAELIFDGVKQVVPIGEEKVLIMDIGGGSTEFIIATKDGVIWKHSFNLGAARMLDFTNPSDPITPDEIEKTEQYITGQIDLLFEEMSKHKIDTLIGSSGSFDTIAAMIASEEHPHLNIRKVTNYEIDLSLYKKLHQKYLQSTYAERMAMKKMDPSRVDMIVLASLFIQLTIKKFNLTKVYQCAYALKEGAIFQILNHTL